MTPGEFAVAMGMIAANGDIEADHAHADELMEAALTELGFGDGVAIFKAMEKWYA